MLQPSLERAKNLFADTLEVFENLRVCHPQNTVALLFEELGPARVPVEFPVGRMCRAIDFDNQSMFPAREVHEKRADGKLPNEFVTTEPPAAQFAPQQFFRRRPGLSKLTAAIGFV